MTSALSLKATIQTQSVDGTAVFGLGTWNLIYVSIIYNDGVFASIMASVNQGIPDCSTYIFNAYEPSVFSESDIITLGAGFIGQIRRFQVYSPAAFQLDPYYRIFSYLS